MSEPTSLSETKRRLFEKYVSGQITCNQAAGATIIGRPLDQPAPLSLVQEQVWRRALSSDGASSFYNESITIHRTAELDIAILERSFTEVIRRHEAWRTTFDSIDGRPIQVIHPAPSGVAIPCIDLRGTPKSSREAEALRWAMPDARRPFDLKQGPLVRALLVTIDEKTHRLFLTMHQSIVDGISVYKILPLELATLYEAFSAGRASPLPDLPVQHADFAYWDRQRLQGQAFANQMAYWREQLAGELPLPNCPSRQSRRSAEEWSGAIRAFTLPKDLCEELKALSQREGVTLFVTLLAGFTAMLSRDTDRNEKIIVGTVAPAGRKHIEVQQLLGYFLNPVSLCIDLNGNPSVHELLRRCQEVTLGALSNDDVPIEYLVQELGPNRDPNRDSLFQMVITLAPSLPELGPNWDQTPMDLDGGWARWDLYLELSDRPSGIIGRAQYRTDIFTSEMISEFLQNFREVLGAIALNSEQRISSLIQSRSQKRASR
ncbi:MAG: condensation domain-containing protein [Bryobacteraceae bacterium]